MPSIATIKVRFFSAPPQVAGSQEAANKKKKPLPPPNVRTVTDLKLQGKTNARIGFEVEATVIYAKPRKNRGAAKLAWDSAIGRSKHRKLAAQAAVHRIKKEVDSLPPAAIATHHAKEQLAKVQEQIQQSDSVLAQDFQLMFDRISEAKEACKAMPKVKQLPQFNASMQAAAIQLDTPKARYLLNALQSKDVSPPFTRTSLNDFGNFIKETAALNLGDTDHIDCQRALAFARNWASASPKHELGTVEFRQLVDDLVDFVMHSLGMVAHPATKQVVGEFRWIDASTLSGPGGKRFLRSVCLGEGSYGSAFLYACGNETVVVKECKVDDENARTAFLAEARVHKQAQTGEHDHIVALLGTVQPPHGGPMLVLEHAPGGEAFKAEQLILWGGERNTITRQAASDACLTMFADMVTGVSQAHVNGVMHLDIKPENFLINGTGRLKLADFGTSRPALAETMKCPTDSPDFSAPEMVHGNVHNERKLTEKADIWSLGVTLYEMTTSQRRIIDGEPVSPQRLRPFPYTQLTSEARDLISDFRTKKEPDRFAQLRLDPLDELHQLIFNMLHPDPSMRPSAQEIANHPLIRPYANPSNEGEKGIVQRARQLILNPPKDQLTGEWLER